MKKYFFLLLLPFFVASCATVFSGTKCKVKVASGVPDSTKVFLDGNFVDYAPCKVTVRKKALKHGVKITLKKEGYQEQDVLLRRKIKVGAFVFDFLCCLVPLVIDFIDGAIWKATPGTIHFNLEKKLQ